MLYNPILDIKKIFIIYHNNSKLIFGLFMFYLYIRTYRNRIKKKLLIKSKKQGITYNDA